MKLRPAHLCDGYKTGHLYQMPVGTELVYSNFTCRSNKLADLLPDFDDKIVFFGLQGMVKWLFIDLWNTEFFMQPKDTIVAQYKRRMDGYLGVGAVGTEHIAALHDLGYLPIEIKALPEGSRVNSRVPPFTMQSTVPEFAWLTNYLEDQFSAEVWKSIRIATVAYEYRRLLDRYADLTGSPKEFVPFQGHDFSFRGMSGVYDAASHCAGHLLSFLGTDTIPAIDYLEDYYNAENDFIAASVPATEHMVACMGILGVDETSKEYQEVVQMFIDGGEIQPIDTKLVGEYLLIKRLVTEVYPKGIVSLVSDTFDFFRTITTIIPKLKNIILNRGVDALGFSKTVLRPDSGNPVKIIAGDPDAPIGSPEYKGAVECLWDVFGGTITSTGHKLLDSHVGVIYGDSITLKRAFAILEALHQKGFASANIVFGIGSFTYQMCTRDSHGCAIKSTYGIVNGEGRELYKDPKTDNGTKKSARGLLRVEKEGNDFVLYDQQTREQEQQGCLETMFFNSRLIRDEKLSDIRQRLLG